MSADDAGRRALVALGRVTAALGGDAEKRPGQEAMAAAVAAAIENGRHLAVQAGTGTGKSFAYLVPVVCSGRRCVVATATKALQGQLGSKDLPAVARALGRRVSFAVLKGRANYLCLERLRESERAGERLELATGAEPAGEGSRRTGGFEGPGSLARRAREIVAWASRTRTGDREELAFEPEPALWASFSVSAEECPGARRCPSGGECFAERAWARAAAADVVVVNLHLLGAHLASGGELLPEHEVLVVDEAHEAEDVLSEALGRHVGPGRVRAVAVAARAALGAAGGRGARRAAAGRGGGALVRDGRDLVEECLEAASRLEASLGPRAGFRVVPGEDRELFEAVELVSRRVGDVARALRERPGGEPQLLRAVLAAEHLLADLEAVKGAGEDDVRYVTAGARPQLAVAPLEVGASFGELAARLRSVVLTSATMPSGLAARLGLAPERTEVLEVPSHFPYERHALLYCAVHLPDPRAAGAPDALWREIAALVSAAGGRTLALFTSHRAMTAAAAAVAAGYDGPILVQGEQPKSVLVERFSARPEACLFATMGFWQGVDVPGPTLSLVVIDRLPFPRPDDPLLAARRERLGARAFREVDLPRAATLLAQGAGRLVRSATDKGVVAVLDPRLATAPYRWDLIRALPPMRRTRDREEVLAFLAQLRREHEESSTGPGAPGVRGAQ